MAVSKEEQNRELTDAEKRRLERFEQKSAQLLAQGYRQSELTVGIVRANVLTLLLGVPVAGLGIVAFFLVNRGRDITMGSFERSFVLIAAVLVLTVVHELIHGLTWSFFTKNRWADIEFGFMKEYLTPYCTATSPLPKGGYIVGALMPMIVLGMCLPCGPLRRPTLGCWCWESS